MRLVYAASFAAIGGGFIAIAFARGSAWWLAAWPGTSFLVVAAAYARGKPAWFGKRASGTFGLPALVVLGPFLLFTWATWHAARFASREPAGHEVAPGVWVGRRAGASELPPDTRLVVDLTCEMWAPRQLSDDGRDYVCAPTLDGTAPDDATVCDLLQRVGATPGGVYIHCAQGRGRSAALATAVLIARGVADNVEQAEAMLRKARPSVRLNAEQRRWVRRVSGAIER